MLGTDDTGRWRLVGLGASCIVLLLVAVTVTAATNVRRAAVAERRSAVVELADRAAGLRAATNDLFTLEVASAIAVLERRPAALDPTDPSRRREVERLTGIGSELTEIAADVAAMDGGLDPGVHRELAAARTAFDSLAALDTQMAADYRSGDPVRRRAAVEVATSGRIEGFQVASAALVRLSGALNDEARRASDAGAALAHRVQLLLVGLTTTLLTALGGLLLWVWRGDRRRHQVISRLTIEANLDPLTNVANRRQWDHALDTALLPVATASPLEARVTVVLIDLDHFKRFNDTYGHPAGDRHLRAVAAILSEAVRRDDLVARLGGEEFGLLLRGSAAADAARVVERLRPLVPDHQTLSAGVAQWDGEETAAELVARADLALYGAKAAGRDRLALADG